jgi:hypothetical protein
VGHVHRLSSVEMEHAIHPNHVVHVQLIVEHAHQHVLQLINMGSWKGQNVFLKSLAQLENVDV